MPVTNPAITAAPERPAGAGSHAVGSPAASGSAAGAGRDARVNGSRTGPCPRSFSPASSAAPTPGAVRPTDAMPSASTTSVSAARRASGVSPAQVIAAHSSMPGKLHRL